ncbi:ketosteroid isomerase-like protein [Roseibium hamelinense]|uniref:Ketosteroid isomerase-like protein n=1 Tax=Roseibium hamelinense TaxID=150831 RepID=A0A562SGZ5_9HYPH|nr:nuclear transport factor 2 family protein [Roseibium hamelinense]MTI44216.1 nuclear transport factor 2 family protein [Roseibium hamelinense]TWI80000.1 ketosteroid isomerase-like protein [Roseibium hamelinense]
MTRIAKKPQDVGACVSAYLEEGDLEGIVSMFHPDCVICFPPEEPPKHGHVAVREVFAGLIGVKPKAYSKVVNLQVKGDTALVQSDWRFCDAGGTLLAEGKSTEVVRKLENGGWGYFIDCPLGPPVFKD